MSQQPLQNVLDHASHPQHLASASRRPDLRARPTASIVACLFWLVAAATICLAGPGDFLTTFGDDGLAFEGSASGHPVMDTLLHPDHGLLLAVQSRTDAFEPQIRLIQVDVATGAFLYSTILPPLIDSQATVHLEDDGMGGVIVATSIPIPDGGQFETDLLLLRVDSGLVLDQGFGLRQLGFDLDDGREDPTGVVVLSDGRIVVLVPVFTSEGPAIGLAFLLPDGSLDGSLPNGGLEIVSDPFGVGLSPVAMAVDSQDRLWIGCYATGATTDRLAVVRVLPDGLLDPAFATTGIGTLSVRDCLSCSPIDTSPGLWDLELLDDRPYLLASVDVAAGVEEAAIARVTDGGTEDGAFGGWRRTSFPAPSGGGTTALELGRYALAVDPVLKAVVVAASGEDPDASPTQDYVGLARFELNGSLSPAFGEAGVAVRSFGSDAGFTDLHLMVEGVVDEATTSSLRIAVLDSRGSDDVAVMALQGFTVRIFADAFESGDATAWSEQMP